MAQTRERRIFLMWKAEKNRNGYDYYRKGWIHSPVMRVAQRFKIPVREVRAIIEAQRGAPG